MKTSFIKKRLGWIKIKNTKDLLIDLVHNVEATLETNEFGGLPHEVFLEWCIEELTEAG